MNGAEHIESMLRRRGLRVTPQRLAIMQFLHGNTDHPTADDIYQAAKQKHPSISLNTVYKTLEAFEEADLVWRFAVGQKQKFHYDPNTTPHPHVTCIRCGNVDDVTGKAGDLKDAARSLAKDDGYEVLRVEVNIIALCPDCRSG